MQLGAFSVSLAVQDLTASRSFYEKLGFTVTGGDGEKYLMMVNGRTIIGLFQGLFERNILTFNPDWPRTRRAWRTSPTSGTSARHWSPRESRWPPTPTRTRRAPPAW